MHCIYNKVSGIFIVNKKLCIKLLCHFVISFSYYIKLYNAMVC